MRRLACVLLSVNAVAQEGTNFAGRWILQSPAAPNTPRVLVVEQPVAATNVRGEPMRPAYLEITIRREGPSGAITETRRIGVIGGTVGGVRGGEQVPRTHDASRWEEGTLVFIQGSYTGGAPRTGAWTERREAWSLAPDGTLSIEITTAASSAPRQTTRAIYRR
ncbi:MAG TPA: hypothetical protein VFK57_03290 [Vicinamibacterales bacterium]|nr:hypothetical protein [Vicinamibacterales bacterium]